MHAHSKTKPTSQTESASVKCNTILLVLALWETQCCHLGNTFPCGSTTWLKDFKILQSNLIRFLWLKVPAENVVTFCVTTGKETCMLIKKNRLRKENVLTMFNIKTKCQLITSEWISVEWRHGPSSSRFSVSLQAFCGICPHQTTWDLSCWKVLSLSWWNVSSRLTQPTTPKAQNGTPMSFITLQDVFGKSNNKIIHG